MAIALSAEKNFLLIGHCPRQVGTPYIVSIPDFPVDQTTVFVSPTSKENSA